MIGTVHAQSRDGTVVCMHIVYASAYVFRRASMSPCKVVVKVAECERKLMWTGSFS